MDQGEWNIPPSFTSIRFYGYPNESVAVILSLVVEVFSKEIEPIIFLDSE
jgi:hypothetical protein